MGTRDRGTGLRPSSLPSAVASAPPPSAVVSLSSAAVSPEGRNQHGSPKKVSGRETRPSHSGNSGSSPAVDHRPPCLFPSPGATSVLVCVCADHMVTQTRRPDPCLTHCRPWPEELTTESPRPLPSQGMVWPAKGPLHKYVWGTSGFGPSHQASRSAMPSTVVQGRVTRGHRGTWSMNRLRPRDGQTAKETQKNPPTSWPRPKPWACQCCQTLWSHSFLLPLPPVSPSCHLPKTSKRKPRA